MRDVNVVAALSVVAVVVLILVFAPFVTIWSMNTLFALGIEYSLRTWLAMVWLSMVTFGGIAYNTRKRED